MILCYVYYITSMRDASGLNCSTLRYYMCPWASQFELDTSWVGVLCHQLLSKWRQAPLYKIVCSSSICSSLVWGLLEKSSWNKSAFKSLLYSATKLFLCSASGIDSMLYSYASYILHCPCTSSVELYRSHLYWSANARWHNSFVCLFVLICRSHISDWCILWWRQWSSS